MNVFNNVNSKINAFIYIRSRVAFAHFGRYAQRRGGRLGTMRYQLKLMCSRRYEHVDGLSSSAESCALQRVMSWVRQTSFRTGRMLDKLPGPATGRRIRVPQRICRTPYTAVDLR